MTLGTLRAFIFDFDGTVVDSMEEFADIAASVMPKHLPIDRKNARRRYIETSGIPFFEQLEVIFPGNSANAKAADEFEKTKLLSYYEKTFYSDVKETMEHLRSCGIYTIVSSNNFQNLVEEFVAKSDVSFDLVLGYKQGFAKGRDHFEHIRQTYELEKENMTFVGDSIKDGERAMDYGINFIAKAGTFTALEFREAFPDISVISSISEIKDLAPHNYEMDAPGFDATPNRLSKKTNVEIS
jgi:phosphoglycolate phosphatase-like HAD superfamily hydrolase